MGSGIDPDQYRDHQEREEVGYDFTTGAKADGFGDGEEKENPCAMPISDNSDERLIAALLFAQKEVMAWCRQKGWEPDPERTFGDECALLTSEVSEALEAFRDHRFERHYINSAGERIVVVDHLHSAEARAVDPSKCEGMAVRYADGAKPEGVPSELADVFIRLLHYTGTKRIDLGAEYVAKMTYNRTRAWRHGGRAL